MNRLSRRTFLGLTAGASASLAGCFGASRSDGIELDTVAATGSPGSPVVVDPSGTVVLLDFFATWCAPCKPEMAHLNVVRNRFSDGELHLVSITSETDTAAIEQFWETYDGNWPVAVDPELRAVEAYSVRNIPTIVILTADGTEHWRHVGLAGEEKLVEHVQGALEASG